MSTPRTPPGYGIDNKLGGSQPNLSNTLSESESDFSQVTTRNKRKREDDDTTTIKNELLNLKKQMADMMALLTVSSKTQKENTDKLC
jgi:adenylate kinase family enzyme